MTENNIVKQELTGTDVSIEFDILPGGLPEKVHDKFEDIISEMEQASRMTEEDMEVSDEVVRGRLRYWEEELDEILRLSGSDYRIEFLLEGNVIYMLLDEDYYTKERINRRGQQDIQSKKQTDILKERIED